MAATIRQHLLVALERIACKDSYSVFAQPVDSEAVPQYREVVEHPMDLGTMRRKVERDEYAQLDQVIADCELVWNNCYLFNEHESIFCKEARKCQREARSALHGVKKTLLDEDGGRFGPLAVFAVGASMAARRLRAPSKKKHASATAAATTTAGRAAADAAGGIAPAQSTEQQRASGRDGVCGTMATEGVAASAGASVAAAQGDAVNDDDKSVHRAPPPPPSVSKININLGALDAGGARRSAPPERPQRDEEKASPLSQQRPPPPPPPVAGPRDRGGPAFADAVSRNAWVPSAPDLDAFSAELSRLWPKELVRTSSALLTLMSRTAENIAKYDRQRAELYRGLVRSGALRGMSAAQAQRQALASLSSVLLPLPAGVTSVDATLSSDDGDERHPEQPEQEQERERERQDEATRLAYRGNACWPTPHRQSLSVADYATSLKRFFAGAGVMARRIIAELLSPEIERVRLKEGYDAARAEWLHARQREIAARMAEWEDACERLTANANKLKDEQCDEEWLDELLDDELRDDVDSLPLDELDLSMLFGVSVRELEGLAQYLAQHAGGVGGAWIEELIAHTRAVSPAAHAVRGGSGGHAAARAAQQRPRQQQQQQQQSAKKARTAEAAHRSWSARGDAHRAGAADAAGVDVGSGGTMPASAASPSRATAAQAAQSRWCLSSSSSGASTPKGDAATATAVSGGGGRSDGGSGGGSATRPRGVFSDGDEIAPQCANCGTSDTPGWRQGETAEQRLCNACGLFWTKYHKQRPPNLWKRGTSRRGPYIKGGKHKLWASMQEQSPQPLQPLQPSFSPSLSSSSPSAPQHAAPTWQLQSQSRRSASPATAGEQARADGGAARGAEPPPRAFPDKDGDNSAKPLPPLWPGSATHQVQPLLGTGFVRGKSDAAGARPASSQATGEYQDVAHGGEAATHASPTVSAPDAPQPSVTVTELLGERAATRPATLSALPSSSSSQFGVASGDGAIPLKSPKQQEEEEEAEETLEQRQRQPEQYAQQRPRSPERVPSALAAGLIESAVDAGSNENGTDGDGDGEREAQQA